MGALHDLHRSFRERVSFFVVYIREAHPEDGWVLIPNRLDDVAVLDPVDDTARADVAAVCALRLEVEIPVLVDRVDDDVARAYGGWPDRIYLIGADGRIAYQGGEGPDGFRPDELAGTLERL